MPVPLPVAQRILLVDDEATFRASLAEGLGDGRDRVIYTASDGLEAVRELDLHEIDLVLTDLQMPRMTGFELVAYLARQRPGVAVIVTTAFGTADMEHNFRMLGVADYLEKPIDVQMVSDRIDKALSRSRNALDDQTAHRSLTETLAQASADGSDGECVVLQGSESGRVFFVHGKIAWVTASTVRETLMTRIVANTTLSMAELREVFDECKRTQRNFGETLVSWGLIDRHTLRQMLLDHISLALTHLAAWTDAQVLFVPEKRTYHGQLLFGVAELVHAALALCPGEPVLIALARRWGIFEELPADPTPLPEAIGQPHDETDTPSTTTTNRHTNGGEPSSPERNEDTPPVQVADATTKGDEKMSELNAILDGLKIVDGFMAAAAFTGEGEVIAALGGAGFSVEELGVLANDVLLKAQKTTDLMGVGRGNQILITAPRASILVRCLNENTDFTANEPGRAHVHLMLVLEPEANVGLGKMRVEKAIQQMAPILR